MNKKLIALAVVAAASAPLAAQADVTIYGQLGVSYNSVNTGATRTSGFTSNKSRLGFKGDEDLGDGLKAIWNMETEVGVTDKAGSQALNNRNTFVGLSDGSVGTVRVGNFDSPYKRAQFDPFGDTMADANSIMGHVQADSTNYGGDFNDRIKNSIGYDASFNNVDLAAQLGTANKDGVTAGNSRTGAYSVSLGYSGIENADFGVAYEKHNNVTTGTGTSAKATKVFGNYTFANLNDLKVGAAYESLKSDVAGNNRKDWLVNASLPFAGNNAVMAEYAKAKSADNTSNTGAKLAAVGVAHNFSKRTSVYAEYARMSNDSGVAYGFASDSDSGNTLAQSAASSNGQTVKGLSVGMVHKF